jgi:glycosyltransferase involved in cell wall biosynthesis
MDGGSTDNSIDIIRKYEHHLAYWESKPDKGQSHAINKGFERATGRIFGWLNSDDRYAPGALHAVAAIFTENPDMQVIVGAGEMVDEEGNSFLRVARDSITLDSIFNWIEEFFWQPSCFFTKTVWDVCGPLDENIHYALDVDFWIKIAPKYNFYTTDILLSYNLKHSKAKTTEFEYLSRLDAYWAMLKNGFMIEARKGIERYVKQLTEALAYYENHENELNLQIVELNNKAVELNQQIDSLQHKVDEKVKRISEMENSSSWKVTRPLRVMSAKLNKLKMQLKDKLT